MKHSIIFIALLFLANEVIAHNEKCRKGYSNLKIRLDSSFSIKLLDSVSLISKETYLDTHWEYDTKTKSFNYLWGNLPNGKYQFRIKTIFDRIELFTINLTGDTSFVISNMYELLNLNNLSKTKFNKADSIRIYFKSSGCFHNSKQKMTLKKITDEKYQLMFCYDTIRYQKINGRTMVLEVPVFKYKIFGPKIIDSLFQLVNESAIKQKRVQENGLECGSTTHEYLYVLMGNTLFQFSDSGICDWNLYSNFRKEFINELFE